MSDMNDLRTILTDSVEGVLSELVTREALVEAEGGAWPKAIWAKLEEQGMTLPMVGEAGGGIGAGWFDVYPIFRAAGRHGVPVPLAESIIAAFLLDRSGLKVPEGPLSIAVPQRGEHLSLRRNGGEWRASGSVARVPWGKACRHVVILASDAEGPRVALVETAKLGIAPGLNIAREPRDSLTFADVPVAACAPAGEGIGPETPLFLGAMARSAQLAGALDQILATTVDYANTRTQFGRQIGKYQAIQFQLAGFAGQAAASGLAAEVAFRAADRQADPRFEIACAKARTSEAAHTATSVGHQTHGAIAFTYDHGLHFTTKRAWSWRAEFGTVGHWQHWIGDFFAGPGAPPLWSFVTGR